MWYQVKQCGCAAVCTCRADMPGQKGTAQMHLPWTMHGPPRRAAPHESLTPPSLRSSGSTPWPPNGPPGPPWFSPCSAHLYRLLEVAGVVRVLKWVLPHQHHVQRHPAAPHVRDLAIILLAIQHLGGDVGGRAHRRLGLRVEDRRLRVQEQGAEPGAATQELGSLEARACSGREAPRRMHAKAQAQTEGRVSGPLSASRRQLGKPALQLHTPSSMKGGPQHSFWPSRENNAIALVPCHTSSYTMSVLKWRFHGPPREGPSPEPMSEAPPPWLGPAGMG